MLCMRVPCEELDEAGNLVLRLADGHVEIITAADLVILS